MRIFILLFVCMSLTMCKTKEAIPKAEPISYVVVLDQSFSPRAITSKVKHNVLEISKYMGNDGQWLLEFENEGKKSSKIKADLLNLDFVYGVYTIKEIDEINSKTRKKKKVGIKSNNSSKQ